MPLYVGRVRLGFPTITLAQLVVGYRIVFRRLQVDFGLWGEGLFRTAVVLPGGRWVGHVSNRIGRDVASDVVEDAGCAVRPFDVAALDFLIDRVVLSAVSPLVVSQARRVF